VPVDASSDQIAAARTALQRNPFVRNVEFVDAAASYEQAARVWRNNPDVFVERFSPDDFPASFRFAYERRHGDAVKATLEALGVEPVTDGRHEADAVELTTFACSAYDNYRP
jgi:hypothetical protein